MLDAIEETGELDNTLVIYILGDNGASAEGALQGLLNEMTVLQRRRPRTSRTSRRGSTSSAAPTTYNHYPVGWAHAMDTPFQWTKQVASHFGGTRNGMVDLLAGRIKDKGGIRTQFHHVIDIVPTILEAAGVAAADDGQRRRAEADRRRQHGLHLRRREGADPQHRTQYFEMLGQPRDLPRRLGRRHHAADCRPGSASAPTSTSTTYKWELYNIDEDFSEADDLAAQRAGEAEGAPGPVLERGGQVQRPAAGQPPASSVWTSASARA